MLEEQGLLKESVQVYEHVCAGIKQEVEKMSWGFTTDEVSEEDSSEIVDLKRARGMILSKLGKIYCADSFSGYDIEQAITTYKTAIKVVHGVNNKQNIALMLQSLLTQVNRDHELAQFKEYLPDQNPSESLDWSLKKVYNQS